MNKLLRPTDKALYAPIRTQNQTQQAMRAAALTQRMAASSIRPEKRNGLVRSARPSR